MSRWSSVVGHCTRAVVAVALFGATALVGTDAVTALAPRFGLVAQTFNVASTGSVAFTLQLPASVALGEDNFTLVVTAFRPIGTRAEVAGAIAGELPRAADSVRLDPTQVARRPDNQLQAVVPVETTRRTAPALQLAQPGLYPVLVELQVGKDSIAEVLTFVHRLPAEDEEPEQPMPIGMAVTTDTPVRMTDDAHVIIDAATKRELANLADLLESSAIPISVRVPPSLLTELPDSGDDGAALAERLGTAMQHNDLLSSPILPLDPSAAAADDQQALYTQWLRDGEDALARSVAAPAQRTIVLVDTPLSRGGGVLLRDLGARLLVIPTRLYDQFPNTLGGYTDTTQLVQIAVAPGVTLDAAIVDRDASRALSRITTTPQLSAIYQVTDLLAARQQIVDQGGDPRRHSVTLATPDLTMPSPSGFEEFTKLLASTEALRPTTLDDISVRTDELLNGEGPVVVDLPEEVDGSIAARTEVSNRLGLQAASTSSMLPPDDPRIAEWTRLLGVMPSSAVTDAQVTGIAADLQRQYKAVLDSVEVPTGFSFNLTGRSGTVPVTLRNNSDIPLTVKVRMSSSKLLFPDGDQTVELPPFAFQEVRIPIEARTNGRFPVTLDVITPLGDVRITPPVPLTASITALSGIGNLVTGVALLVLLTWWARHFRRSRRARAAAEAARRHPVTMGDGTGVDDGAALSPDAATSTLPPS